MIPAILTSNLDIESVKIIENGQLIIPDRLDLLEPGMSLIVAINEGPTLANRYAQVSRIDKVKNALMDWAKTKTITSMDDFSLVTNSGIITSNLNKPTDWVDVLDELPAGHEKIQTGSLQPFGSSGPGCHHPDRQF